MADIPSIHTTERIVVWRGWRRAPSEEEGDLPVAREGEVGGLSSISRKILVSVKGWTLRTPVEVNSWGDDFGQQI